MFNFRGGAFLCIREIMFPKAKERVLGKHKNYCSKHIIGHDISTSAHRLLTSAMDYIRTNG